MSEALPIGIWDVEKAADRLKGYAVTTPLLEFANLNERCGGRVFLKPETLQRTGSFKFRGAFNKISTLSKSERAAGVVAYSSGNHGQGVACAAGMLGAKATIIMPKDAPMIKIRRTRGFGADVILYDRQFDDRQRIADNIVSRNGAIQIDPFDDPLVMAGQGTIGLEIAEQAQQIDVLLNNALAPCGGGGLISGVSTALHSKIPQIKIYAVEPANCDDTARSLSAGKRLQNEPRATSICDALLSPTPGALTFAVNRTLLEQGLVVTDREVRDAMHWAFENLKLVVEPGGIVALAALLCGRLDVRNQNTVLVLSGGNVDGTAFAEIVAEVPL